MRRAEVEPDPDFFLVDGIEGDDIDEKDSRVGLFVMSGAKREAGRGPDFGPR